MDRTVYDFLYHYWFRCEVEGIENVPSSGGALLVSNHAGALPPDAAMIAKAIKEEHARPRPLHLTVEHFFKGYPGLQHARRPRSAACPPTRPTCTACCDDEEQLVLVFPEGRKGTEKLYKDRYRLRRFGRGGFVEAAMRARAPIVPVAVVGAEEAMPIFAHVGLLQRLTGLLYFPITPTFPHFGLLGFLGYLPAKFSIRFLEPVPTDQWGERAVAGPRARADGRRRDPRADPGGADRHARPPPLGLVRMTRDPRHRRVDATGAAGSRRRSSATRASRRSSASAPTTRRCELERTEFVARRHPARAAAADRAGGRDRHGDRHAAGRRLDPGLAARRPREQRDRHDEHPRRLRRAGLARAQGRLQVLGALLRLRARRPGVLHRGDAAPAPAAHAPGVATSSRPRSAVAASPSATRTSR